MVLHFPLCHSALTLGWEGIVIICFQVFVPLLSYAEVSPLMLIFPKCIIISPCFCDWPISWLLLSVIKDVNVWFKISTQGHESLEHPGFVFNLVIKVMAATCMWPSHSLFPHLSLTSHLFFSYGKPSYFLEAQYASVTFLCVSYHIHPFSYSTQIPCYYFSYTCNKFSDLFPLPINFTSTW